MLTLRHHFPEDGHGLQRGAVPPSVPELELTLVDGQLGPAAHCVHHLDAALADLHLGGGSRGRGVGWARASDTNRLGAVCAENLSCFYFQNGS